jgi:hypothetical protein
LQPVTTAKHNEAQTVKAAICGHLPRLLIHTQRCLLLWMENSKEASKNQAHSNTRNDPRLQRSNRNAAY